MVKTNEILKKIIMVYESTIGYSWQVGKNEKFPIESKLDSIDIMKIIVSLEDEFDIEFDNDELDEDIFVNIETVYNLVKGKMKGE